MTKIESKIGKISTKTQPLVKNYVVDDPSMDQAMDNQNSQSSSVVESLSENWRQLSPQEYNQMRKELLERGSITATEDIIPKGAVISELTDEDKEILNKISGPVKQKENKVKNKIEILLGLKHKKIYKEIDGHKIGLKNLNSEQTKYILEQVSYLESGVDRIYTTKHMVLALALDSVDGEPISNILKSDDTLENKTEIIRNMDNSVVDELYKAYVLEIQNQISITTKDKAQEVAEEIKKQ